MSERKEGLYFVKHPAHDGWLTGFLDRKGRYQINGYGKYLDESSFESIGPRIPTPDEMEGWQLMPKEPNFEMLAADGCAKDHGKHECIHHENRRRIWNAMLEAAPKLEDQ